MRISDVLVISNGCGLFWSNTDGWTSLSDSDVFSKDENNNLPVGGNYVGLLDSIERMMRIAKDTKKEFSYSKCSGKWAWESEGEMYQSFLECLEDSIEPYLDE